MVREKKKKKRREREREREMMDSGERWWTLDDVMNGGLRVWSMEVQLERERDEKNMNLFSFGEKVLLPKEMSEESMLNFFG